MAAPTFTSKGAKSSTAVTLDKSVFNIDVKNHQLLKDAYTAHLANSRLNLAVTKTRGLVRGGGKKPWKQKGTGRARFGSSRVPLWRGGGITFGPTGNENYKKNLNVKAKRLAIRQALSLANDAKKVVVIDKLDAKTGKVKPVVDVLNKINARRSILLVVENKDEAINKSTGNIADLKVVQAKYLNVFDVLNADSIVIEKPALQIISEWLGGDK